MEEKKRKHVSLLGPALLIVLGTVLLLNTLEILDWSVWWTILSLWPLLLIAAGLDLLIGRRSIWGSLLVVVLVFAIAGGVLWLSANNVVEGAAGEPISHPLGDATEAAISLDPGVGILSIEVLPESANLVEGTVQTKSDGELATDFSTSGSKATLELRGTGEPWIPFFGGLDARREWDLGLTPGAALDLETSLGLGEARLDLTGLQLSSLDTDMGIGLTTVTLPAAGRYQATISGAIGETTILIPRDLGVRIHIDTGLATRQVPEGYRQDGDVYTSPGYETAENQVNLDIEQAIGILKIRYAE